MLKLGAAFAGVFLLSITQASAFGTIGSVGQNQEHERITRLALAGTGIESETLDELAGKDHRMGAVGAPDSPDRGLMDVEAAHCDSGDYLAVPGYPQTERQAYAKLDACRKFIMRALRKAVNAAGAIVDRNGGVDTAEIPSFVPCNYNGKPGRAKCDVMGELGLAFHAAQDFYSHTNWVDIPANGPIRPDNPPGLGQSGPAPWLDPRRGGGPVPGLISGCYHGKPERAHCGFTSGNDRVRHKYLNKDLGPINVRTGAIGTGQTPRGAINGNFARAVQAAILDTRDKWRYFEQAVLRKYGKGRGDIILCAIRHDADNACR